MIFCSFFNAIPIFSSTTLYTGRSFPVYNTKTTACWWVCSSASCRVCFCNRQASLISLLIRLRSTAFLKFRLLTLKAACNFVAGSAVKGAFVKIIFTGYTAKDRLFLNNCSMALRLFSRSFLPSVYRTVCCKWSKLKKPRQNRRGLLFTCACLSALGGRERSIFYQNVRQKLSVCGAL